VGGGGVCGVGLSSGFGFWFCSKYFGGISVSRRRPAVPARPQLLVRAGVFGVWRRSIILGACPLG